MLIMASNKGPFYWRGAYIVYIIGSAIHTLTFTRAALKWKGFRAAHATVHYSDVCTHKHSVFYLI